MVVKVFLQCLAILVLLQSSLLLVFRNTTQSDMRGRAFCGRCRTDVKVDINKTEATTVILPETQPGVSPSRLRKSIIVELKYVKKSTKNVFFVESSCGTRKLVRAFNKSSNYLLSARQSCAVESAARANPGRDIYILHTCPLSDDFLSRAPEYARKLLELPNVHVVRVTLAELFQDSPVQQLFESGRMDDSFWPVIHASDIIRVLILWKFGGTYSDLDFITIRSFDQLGSNFAGYEFPFSINNALLNFDPFGYGHSIATKCLQFLNSFFDGKKWAVNGPQAITKIIHEECSVYPEIEDDCNTFTVFHTSVFYPVSVMNHDRKHYFDASSSEELMKSIKSTTFSVHLWNSHTKSIIVDVGANHTFAHLAEEFCPVVYGNCGPIF